VKTGEEINLPENFDGQGELLSKHALDQRGRRPGYQAAQPGWGQKIEEINQVGNTPRRLAFS